MTRVARVLTITAFLSRLKWIDGTPLRVEPYRMKLFERANEWDEDAGRIRYNLILHGRSKKNFKTCDEVLNALYALVSPARGSGVNECYLVANDEDQAGDALSLAKLLVRANPVLNSLLVIRRREIARRDGLGFLRSLAGGDDIGSHGKTYRYVGFDEIHGLRDWSLLEAMQLDPTRPDSQMVLTSYASIFHRPGVPLYDLMRMGRAGTDPRMLFSWYAADFTTDPDFADATPEQRANPSMGSWADVDYLDQQRRRLPAHKFRRLHLNLPGLPEGSAFQAEPITDAIERGVMARPPKSGVRYIAAVDMSGGSSDDAVLAIAHLDEHGRAVLDLVQDQGPRPPFDPRMAVARFAGILKSYGLDTVYGDAYAGRTFVADFAQHGIDYVVDSRSASDIYEAFEVLLNTRAAILLDVTMLEQQLLGLVWSGEKITHLGGEHDDFCTAGLGALVRASEKSRGFSDEVVAGIRALARAGMGGDDEPPAPFGPFRQVL